MEEKTNRFIIFPEEVEEVKESDALIKENVNSEVGIIDSENSLRAEVIVPDRVTVTETNYPVYSEEVGQPSTISIPSYDEVLVVGNVIPSLEKEESVNEEVSEQGFDSNLIEVNESELEEVSEVEEKIISTEGQQVAFQNNRSLQDMINKILKIDQLSPVEVELPTVVDPKIKEEAERRQQELEQQQEAERKFRKELYNVVNKEDIPVVFKSDLFDKIQEHNNETGGFSILTRYGEDYCSKDFVTNPAIGRDEEIKQLILTLLTPEKSAILIGKPGIGKTSIVEGLAYRLQRGLVPEALQGFAIVNVKTPSLIGSLPSGETRLQTLVDELKQLDHVILFIDEIHMLIGATNDSAMDFANMFKEGLGRGQIKVIGATTTEEYERYVLRDKAFVRRFQAIDVKEPSREHTIKILMGTLPKIEKDTGAKLKYTTFIQSEIMAFITDITSEYKRVYGIGSRYPDICLTLLKEAFSQCIFDNRNQVTIFDVRDAIENSKNIYPDVIRKELPRFDEKFKKIIEEERLEDDNIDRL